MARRAKASPSGNGNRTRVLLTGGPGLLRDALKVAFSSEKMDVTVADPASIRQTLDAVLPDVVLVPGGDPDITVDLIREVVEIGYPTVTIARDSTVLDQARLIDAGAGLVIGPDAPYADLIAAVREVAAGHTPLPLGRRYELEEVLREHRKAEARRNRPFEELSARERAIFALLYEGLSAEQIADEECISMSTVRSHVRKILTTLNVHSQLAAVAMARSRGWFEAVSLDLTGHRG